MERERRVGAVAILKIGRSHRARKQLFQRGLRRGFLTIQEIETALPPGSLTAAERWLLYYSLRAAEIEIRDESGNLVTVPSLSPEELEQLATERRETAEVVAQTRVEAAKQDDDGAASQKARRAEEALAALEDSPEPR